MSEVRWFPGRIGAPLSIDGQPPRGLWEKARPRRMFPLVGLVAVASALLCSSPAWAQQFRWGAVYQHWSLSAPASNIDTWMWPSMANDDMFFTQVFSIEGSGSYMGLQQEGEGSRQVRFSIWNAMAFRESSVEGAACRRFGGEGVGMTCTIPYAWETGRWYRLRIRMLDSDAEGQWWGAWVMDDTGREQRVGDIRAPGPALITSTSSFNEYYGRAEGFPCGRPPPSAVHVYQPLVDDDSSRAPARGGSLLQCSGGRVTELWNGELARLDLHTDRVVGPAPAVPPVAIDLVDGVDLVVHSPRTDLEIVAPGTALTLSADVRNLGTTAAPATNLSYYRSTDSTISTTDTRTGSVPIAGLPAAAAATASVDVTAPGTVGTHYFGACVDGVPAELNGDNNCSAGVPVVVTVDDATTRAVLVEIYDATGGSTWSNRTNWLSDRPIGTWHGVTTNATGNVTHLKLSNNGLVGSIPEALVRLPLLEDLRLAGNELVGPIPAWLETLPLLRELWLDSNRLSGRLPTELGALTRLGHLSLDRNAALSGPVPAEFGNLTTLWTLRLNHTGLSGPLPLVLANLRSLNYMDVRNTGLCAPDDPAFQSWLRTVNVINGGIATCTRPPVNRRPEPVSVLAPLTLEVDDAAAVVEVGGAFRDPDGDALTYGAASSAPSVASVAVVGSTVTVMPMGEGTATIRVTATDPGGLSAVQVFTVTVGATVGAPFTDDPIVPGVTPVKAVHFAELRTRIDALRRAGRLARFSWTDPALRAGVTRVRRVHLLELRTALAEAYAASGRPVPRWTDTAPVGGATPIRATHVTELRAAVLALE